MDEVDTQYIELIFIKSLIYLLNNNYIDEIYWVVQ